MKNKHSRAHTRFHRDRIIKKRKRFLRRWPAMHWYLSQPDNKLAIKHPLDCGCRCFMCHGDKLVDTRRAREKREWQKINEVAY